MPRSGRPAGVPLRRYFEDLGVRDCEARCCGYGTRTTVPAAWRDMGWFESCHPTVAFDQPDSEPSRASGERGDSHAHPRNARPSQGRLLPNPRMALCRRSERQRDCWQSEQGKGCRRVDAVPSSRRLCASIQTRIAVSAGIRGRSDFAFRLHQRAGLDERGQSGILTFVRASVCIPEALLDPSWRRSSSRSS
jgi:hypothetical protein